MSRITLCLVLGFYSFDTGIAAAQPTEEPSPPVEIMPAPEAAPVTPNPASEVTTQLPPQPSAVPPEQPLPRVPSAGLRFVTLHPVSLKRLKRDRRIFTFGAGPLILANVHWLDQLSDKTVNVGSQRGEDNQYPGFVGLDATLGLMLDVRYEHFIGVEVDIFRRNDRGTGTISIRDEGSICFIPGLKIAYPIHSYDVTIGQMAWHVPLLFKLTLPGRKELVHEDGDVDREIRKSFGTLAFGPEFVFPGLATLSVNPPTGLDHPNRAFASNYIMFTGALGFERRVADSHDIRLLFSARGSYNPAAGDSAMKRAEYAAAGGNIVAVAYRSEWRYQAALTFGVGWFF